MYKFTITYHYEKYHTGATNYSTRRQAIVYAESKQQAIEKITKLDSSFIRIADNGLFAEEINSM